MSFLDPRARARFVRSKSALVGGVLVGGLVVFAIVTPLVAAHGPNASDFVRGVAPNEGPVGPGADFLLGTDRLFRDQLVRLAFGARLSLVIGVAATAIASVIGAAVGIVSGYYEGSRGLRVPWLAIGAAAIALVLGASGRRAVAIGFAIGAVALLFFARVRRGGAPLEARAAAWAAGPRVDADAVLMRFVDVALSFPFLLLVMAIGAALDDTSVASILVVLGLTGWLGTARLVRAKTLQVRNLEFVVAARALGQKTPQILWKHVLPNVAGLVVVIATISVAQMIVAESVLSYLGVGLPPPAPTWGRMLAEGQDYYMAAPWLFAAPAGAILIAVFGFNLLGEGLRDALDPKED